MASAVVAQQAVHVGEAQESLGHGGCFAVPDVLIRASGDARGDDPVELALSIIIGSLGCDKGEGNLVVASVVGERGADIRVQSVAAAGIKLRSGAGELDADLNWSPKYMVHLSSHCGAANRVSIKSARLVGLVEATKLVTWRR